METFAHVATLTVIGAILGGIGAGLAWVNAMAVGLMPLRWPPRPLPLMLTAPPRFGMGRDVPLDADPDGGRSHRGQSLAADGPADGGAVARLDRALAWAVVAAA
jgi:hypothetical protein